MCDVIREMWGVGGGRKWGGARHLRPCLRLVGASLGAEALELRLLTRHLAAQLDLLDAERRQPPPHRRHLPLLLVAARLQGLRHRPPALDPHDVFRPLRLEAARPLLSDAQPPLQLADLADVLLVQRLLLLLELVERRRVRSELALRVGHVGCEAWNVGRAVGRGR
mgnify:CR=1 FL=1